MSRLALLVGLALAALAAVEHSPRSIPGTTLVLDLPADWAAIPVEGSLAYAAHHQASGAGVAVAVEPLGDERGHAAFSRDCLERLKDYAVGLEIVDSRFGFTIGTRPWSMLRYRLRLGQVPFEQMLYITAEGGQGICLTFSAPTERFHEWLPRFDALVWAASGSRPTLGR